MNNQYLTVTALTKYIKRKIDTDPHLKNIWLKGEISNFKHHSRGHMYMTIKDDQARIQAVMFAGNNRYMKFQPENGMNVLIRGEISVYEAHGQYQLYIAQMEPDGIGALYLAFEQLKEKLNKKGYFDPIYKKDIPLYPKDIGVITSPTGAAVRDIITTIKRRYPIVNITVIPVLVQGPNAAKSIKNGIEIANRAGSFDTLIIGRGGGSIEELWSFNEEIVADAIFHSSIPIISAVGHETDTTISDYVADLRAPTPTGAAELAVLSKEELNEKIFTYKQALTRELNRDIRNYQSQLARLKNAYAFRYPEQLLKQKEQQLDTAVERLQRMVLKEQQRHQLKLNGLIKRLVAQHPEKQLREALLRIEGNVKRQNNALNKIIESNKLQLASYIDKLTLLNPLEIMKRGFTLPYKENGQIVKTVKDLKRDDQITLKFRDGTVDCQVVEVEEKRNDK
ncbi:exodeoxyribonuclease VII large subunit [Oceanobacillus piezotolerans]|uniref:Exodeoxyribonuclease 7 large subunit n=1 Tax=Oceanobacillus piezotolerans TaxID=2448030 RepID=A0A498DHV9_9BACI|nr:exodeoxyribonuclease VII large subunit [Oceanobacillus piezotolerans]RLL48119.1 exodeoxyribonuclease VII large subunit [Oceanobacillus piezotolerans]